MTICPRCRRTFDDGVRFCPVDGAQVTAEPADRNLGTVLMGQFEVRAVCGRGAMGTVYRAHQRTMDRTVAVKILRRELLQEPDVVRRFLREARAAAKLQHPNIVSVHSVGETDDGVPFLVMEFVDGLSLEAMCEAKKRVPIARVVEVARQIAAALGEAHGAGIVHRDLKPANILVTSVRGKDRVKVLDFGIAKIVDGTGESLITRDGMIFGTPHYIAPEQATGGELDARADLYSLGVILFRLTTGRLPFDGAGMQVVLRHLREPPPRPRDLAPAIPPALESLILACLAKERADRPANAEAIMGELEWIAEALPPDGTLHGVGPASEGAPRNTARVKTVDDSAAPPATRRRQVAWVGGAVAIAAAAVLGVMGARVRRGPPTAPTAALAVRVPPEPVVTPLPALPVLADEHVLTDDGLTVRAGFEHALEAGQSRDLVIALAGRSDGARVEVSVQPEGGREQRVVTTGAGERWHAPVTLSGGRHKLRVSVSTEGRPTSRVLSFDVTVGAARLTERAARPEVRRARAAAGDDLPVTVIPADKPAAMPPRPLAPPPAAPISVAYPKVTLRTSAPHAPAAKDPPATAPAAPPAREAPPPAKETPPPADEPPPLPPPRPVDPTTLPPPAPENP